MKKIGQGRFSGGAGIGSNAPGGLEGTLKKLICRREVFLAPAAGASNVLAQKAADFDVTTGFTHPAHARNLQVVFSAAWDGGNVVVTGYCNDGVIRSETFTAPAGGGTVVGSIPFTLLTEAANTGTFSAGTVDIQLAAAASTYFGLCARRISQIVKLVANGSKETVAVNDLGLGAFQPTTVPNGVVNYEVTYLCEQVGDLAASEEEASL